MIIGDPGYWVLEFLQSSILVWSVMRASRLTGLLAGRLHAEMKGDEATITASLDVQYGLP